MNQKYRSDRQELKSSYISKKPHSASNNKFESIKKYKLNEYEKPFVTSNSNDSTPTLNFSIPSTRGENFGKIDIKVSIDFDDLLLILNQSLSYNYNYYNDKFLNFILKNSEAISKISPQKSMEVFLECLNVSTKINSDNSAKQTQNVSESIEQLKILRDSLPRNYENDEIANKINNVIRNLQNK